MKVINKVELKLDGFEECHSIANNDCPIGRLYDYSCALSAFCVKIMKEAQEAQKQKDESLSVMDQAV